MSALRTRALSRHLRRYPWQLALAVLGIALGVAVVVAVDLANASARQALRLSLDELTGQATHQIVGGPGGVDERLYARLRLAGVRPSAPRVEGYGLAGGETLHLLGVDPFAERGVHGALEGIGDDTLRRLLREANTALLGVAAAQRLGVAAGERLTIELGGYRETVEIVALLSDASADDALLLCDIATAQELLRQPGRLSWIDLLLPEGAAGEAQHRRIETLLPPDARLLPAAARGAALAQLSAAFHTNLTAMSLLALVVGMFLIYNTLRFAVLQRRALIGRLRLLGVTRGEVFRDALGEAALLGLLGTLLGLALGVLLGQGLITLVARTIDDLFFALGVSEPRLSGYALLKGAALGLLASLGAALLPAWQAAATTPLATLRRSALEGGIRARVPRLVLGAVVLAGLGLSLLAVSERALLPAFAALFLLILGLTLLAPPLVALASEALAGPLRRLFGLQAGLAIRSAGAALSRSGVAVAALMLAVAAAIGVEVMVQSFRASVVQWLEVTLQGDIYVTVPSLRSTRSEAALDAGVIERVRQLPGIAAIAARRSVTLETGRGLVEIEAVELPPGRPPRFLLTAGAAAQVWPAFESGRAVLVSEPYAFRNRVAVGDEITLRTAQGERRLPVAGVYQSYETGPGIVLMRLDLYQRLFDDPAIDGLSLYLQPGVAPEAMQEQVRAAVRGEQAALVFANRELRERSLAIFDRTFTITEVLRLLALGVAFVGILSALLALQLERSKELAVLRATGFTPGQVGALVTAQTGFLGLMAGLLAVPTGLVLALLLIHVINRRAFGWSMQTVVPLDALAQSVALAVLAALLAGLYPAWRMARASPAAALREE